jgi:hypothetical protein
VTDVVSEPVDLSRAGELWGFDGRGRSAHGGFLQSALKIRAEVQ